MMRFAVYMAGVVLVLAAIWVLLTQTGVTAFVPIGLIAVALLLLLGLGIMGGADRVREPIGEREVVETKQEVGGTEVRRSRVR